MDNERLTQKNIDPELTADDIKTFERYYPNGELGSISLESVPDDIVAFFVRFDNRNPPNDTLPEDFKLLCIQHDNQDTTYIAKHFKTFENTGDTEEITLIADMRDNDRIGYAELRYNTNPHEFYRDKPFIGSINTDPEVRRTGLGTRRIKLMNALCRMQYGNPLYSDTVNSSLMIATWEKLVETGYARKFKVDEKYDRYVFIDNK